MCLGSWLWNELITIDNIMSDIKSGKKELKWKRAKEDAEGSDILIMDK